MAIPKKDITARYAVVQGLFWANYCILGGFANVYLLAHGFSNTAIGLIVAISGILSACTSPIIAAWADRPETMPVRRIVTIMAAGMIALMALVFLTRTSYVLTVITYTAAMMLIQLSATFTGALAAQSMRSGWKLTYGLARGAGSLMYGLSAHALGWVVARFSPDILPVLGIALWIVSFLFMLRFPDTKDHAVLYADMPADGAEMGGEGGGRARGNADPPQKRSDSPAAFFKRYPRFGLFLIGIFFVYISHAICNVFVTQIVISKGGTDADTGLILGVQALVELPVMFGFAWMLKKVRAMNWMRICAFFYVLKMIGTYAAGSVAAHTAVQIFEMGSYAVMVAGTIYYVNSIMDARDTVKGQSYFGISTTTANVAASLLGGVLLDRWGVSPTLLFGIVVVVIGTLIVFVSVEKPRHAAV